MGLDFWQETDFLDGVSSEVHCSQLRLCSRRTFDIESDQSLCDNSLGNQGDDALGPWDFLRWSSSNCQDNKRATMPGEKNPNPFPPFLWVLMEDWIKKSKATDRRKNGWERWERSHPFQNSSHVLGFQWEDWDITVFCLDSFLYLSFPQTL